MEAQLREAGVDVRLGVKADLAAVQAAGAEAVFIAAGGKPVLPSIPGIDRAVTAEEVLRGDAVVTGEKIVIVGGGVTGLETAEYFANDHTVTVVEMQDKIGGNLYPSIVMNLTQEILKNEGRILKGSKLTSVDTDSVWIEDVRTGSTERIPADAVILAMGVRSERPDYEEFRKAFGDDLILVGDSMKPGQIYDALHSGHDKAFVYAAR